MPVWALFIIPAILGYTAMPYAGYREEQNHLLLYVLKTYPGGHPGLEEHKKRKHTHYHHAKHAIATGVHWGHHHVLTGGMAAIEAGTTAEHAALNGGTAAVHGAAGAVKGASGVLQTGGTAAVHSASDVVTGASGALAKVSTGAYTGASGALSGAYAASKLDLVQSAARISPHKEVDGGRTVVEDIEDGS
jgi:hypothetical protein